VTWDQVAELANSGWEIGAHTHTHAPLTALSADKAQKEILDSKREIESKTKHPVSVFAYPYGDVSAPVLECVRSNFAGAAGTRLGFVQTGSDPFILPRIDAYYLTPFMARNMNTFTFRQYLELRHVVRSVRSRFSQPWKK
jgi:peptidoglycan/xylan/chitin deacetylase (PgdA/CDA1 family)